MNHYNTHCRNNSHYIKRYISLTYFFHKISLSILIRMSYVSLKFSNTLSNLKSIPSGCVPNGIDFSMW